LDTFNNVPAAPNNAVTRPSEFSRRLDRTGKDTWLTERYKGLPRNRHADDKQNTLAVTTAAGHYNRIWHCLILLHV